MKIRANTGAEMTISQLEILANCLVEKRRELGKMLEMLNRQIAMKEDCSITDAGEAATLQEKTARASGVADRHNRTITEIDHALTKLENGRYGISETSGTPIDYERLLLIPWARIGSNE